MTHLTDHALPVCEDLSGLINACRDADVIDCLKAVEDRLRVPVDQEGLQVPETLIDVIILVFHPVCLEVKLAVAAVRTHLASINLYHNYHHCVFQLIIT